MKKEVRKNNTAHDYEVKDWADVERVRQTSSYKDEKCEPDNNLFFEELSNPLSSKGN